MVEKESESKYVIYVNMPYMESRGIGNAWGNLHFFRDWASRNVSCSAPSVAFCALCAAFFSARHRFRQTLGPKSCQVLTNPVDGPVFMERIGRTRSHQPPSSPKRSCRSAAALSAAAPAVGSDFLRFPPLVGDVGGF